MYGVEHADPALRQQGGSVTLADCEDIQGQGRDLKCYWSSQRIRVSKDLYCQFFPQRQGYTEESRGCFTPYDKTNRKMKVVLN